MREQWRALVLLVGAAWRTDKLRSAGLLLEPIGALRIPLFAWFLKVLTDGALRSDARLLAIGAAGLVATRVLAFAGMWIGSSIRTRLTEEVGFTLDREVSLLTAQLPGLEHHERPDYQDKLEMLRQGQAALGGSLNTLIVTANAIVAGVGTLVALVVVSPWLLVLVPFALPAIPIAKMTQKWNKTAEEAAGAPYRRARHLQALTVSREAGMELRVFGLQREILSRFTRTWREGRGLMLAAFFRGSVLDTLGDLLFLAGFGGAVWLMLWRASQGQATVGEVVMAVYLGHQVRSSVVDPIRRLAGVGAVLRAAARLLWLQDYARAANRSGTAPAPDQLRDGIVFDRVGFRYPGTDRWALRNVSLHIPAGSVIALVGENGAGKTTLVKLLCRMYDPTEGRILVDGVDLAEIGVTEWRQRLSAAFQDFARFEVTAQRTVGLGDLPRLDDRAAMLEALQRAGASDVLGRLPEGPDSKLGSRWSDGVDLSTGQWQKLALGRALMRTDPLVVFFDEPTASLDALAEHALFQRYASEARSGSTRGAVTVLVSHRFSTVRSADLILVIENGGVSELGGHDDLLLGEGLYAELYGMQARSYQ
jgi:ATP-binding cassette, subfamily B, bacterial